MGKKDSSDEYEPEEDVEKGSEEDAEEEEEPQIPEYIGERKAKINRREIVESEDSDKISSESGSNSDDYNPNGNKKKISKKRGHKDSDSEEGTPSPVKPQPVKRLTKKRRKIKAKYSSEESSTEEDDDDEDEGTIKPKTLDPVGELAAKFPKVPRADITRVYYQNSLNVEKTIQYLKESWIPGMFLAPSNGKLDEKNKESEDEPTTSRVNFTSSEDDQNPNLNSDDDDSPAEVKTKKRKKLNSSDEEWAPKKKKKPEKRKSRKLSSSEDDMREIDEGNMSDAIDEDYSDSEVTVKRSPTVEKAIHKFLQSASHSELQTVDSISSLKAKYLESTRPIKSLHDFKKKWETMKGCSNAEQLLSNVDELLKGRDMVGNLLKRCKTLSGKLTDLLGANSEGLNMATPSTMNKDLVLKPYQKRGLHWYTQIHHMKMGAILADEMGLGKTVQTISFLAWLKLNHPSFTRPHLVVCPSSTLENWKREFECWLPSFKIHLYYGEHRRHDLRKIIRLKASNKEKFSKRDSDEENEDPSKGSTDGDFENIDVVLTTYQSACSSEQDRVAIKKLGVGYAIFDEGHMLKNMNTNRYQQLMKIGARRRILLTGTPLQNNLLELMSLLKFIMPELLQKSTATLQRIFKLTNMESDFGRKRIEEAKTILNPFVMRRIKADVLKDLPPKTEETMLVPLTDEQRMYYREIQEKQRQSILTMSDDDKSKLKTMKNTYCQLRKVSNHPLLHRNIFTNDKIRKMARILCQNEYKQDGNVEYIFEDLEVMSDFEIHKFCEKTKSLRKFKLTIDDILNSGKFKKLAEILPPIFEKDSRVVLFSQFVIMMDIMEKFLDHHEIAYLRLDGSTPVESRLDLIDEFNADFDIKVFMVSTRAGGLGINLTSADTVILHDIDSNPYNDKQAEDRCHRVGQTKPVHIIRLVSKETVEERMRSCAIEKLKLERKVCKEDAIKYNQSPQKKVEIDAKIEEKQLDEDDEEISQDDLKSLLMPELKDENHVKNEKHVNGDS